MKLNDNQIQQMSKLSGVEVEEIKKSLEQQAEMIEKAFETGHEIDPGKMEGAAPLRVQVLSRQITHLTHSRDDLVFYKRINKVAAQGPVQEYAVFKEYGDANVLNFVREGDVSLDNESVLGRKSIKMKYLSDVRDITFQAQSAPNLQSPEAIETDSAIMTNLYNIEWASLYGDADLTNEGNDNGLEFDGILKLVDQDNILDLRGARLKQEHLNDVAVKVGHGFGRTTDAFMPLSVLGSMTNEVLSYQRQMMSDNSGNTALGFVPGGFHSVRGFIEFHGSNLVDAMKVLDEGYRAKPASPLVPKATSAVEADGKGLFADTAELRYKVLAFGDKARSKATEVVTAQPTNKTDSIKLTIKENDIQGSEVQYFAIYRAGVDGNFYQIARVPGNQTGEDIVFVDTNATIPGSSEVFVGDMSQDTIQLYEWLPMFKFSLARVKASSRFAVMWGGALALRAPKRWAVIKNIGL